MTKNTAKRWVLLVATLLLGSLSNAQSIYFRFNDGTEATYNISDVRSITFTGDVMTVNKKDGSLLNWNVSYIGNYRYEQVTALPTSKAENTAELLLFPNPTQGKVNIRYVLPKADDVSVAIYDLQGKTIQSWPTASQTAGSHELVWQAEGFPKGSYILRCTTAKGSFSKTIVVE